MQVYLSKERSKKDHITGKEIRGLHLPSRGLPQAALITGETLSPKHPEQLCGPPQLVAASTQKLQLFLCAVRVPCKLFNLLVLLGVIFCLVHVHIHVQSSTMDSANLRLNILYLEKKCSTEHIQTIFLVIVPPRQYCITSIYIPLIYNMGECHTFICKY